MNPFLALQDGVCQSCGDDIAKGSTGYESYAGIFCGSCSEGIDDNALGE